MHGRKGTALLAGVATALALGLGATPALASTKLNVKVTHGGSFSASATKSGKYHAAATVVLTSGPGKHFTFTCFTNGSISGSTAAGTISSGNYKGSAPLKVGRVAGLEFSNCTGPWGAVTTVFVDKPYKISTNSTTNGAGQTDATVGKMDIKVSMEFCSFTAIGSAPGYYANSKHTLTMTPMLPITPLTKTSLTISDVNGCLGVYNNGNHLAITATYPLSIPIKIVSS